jgi:hypothetical protein
MYHVELRQFPHNFCRFNLTERELREAILDVWTQGGWIEFGERKWNPHQANLTVIEGPRLALEQLSMGRGWRAAARDGQDVTEQLLAAVRADARPSYERSTADMPEAIDRESASYEAPGGAHAPEMHLLADSLGLEVLAKLSEEPIPLAIVWQLARGRYPDWSASDCLALAEHTVRSLAVSRLAIVLVEGEDGESAASVSEGELDAALRPIEGWSNAPGSASVGIRRT